MRFDMRFAASLFLPLSLLLAAGCTKSTVEKPQADTGEQRHVVQRPVTKDTTLGDEMVAIDTKHPAEVPVGSSYDYTINVTNKSSDKMLHGVVIKQDLPEGFTIEKSEPKQSGDSKKEARWNLGTLNPGETRAVQVTAASDHEGSAHLCFGVDYTPAFCMETKFVQPELQISKQAPKEANMCEPITVKYTVHNTGSGAAEKVMVVDDLDEGLVTAKGEKQVKIDVGTLAAGKSRDFNVQLMPQKAGKFGTRATAKMGDKEVRSNSVAFNVHAAKLDLTLQGPDAEYVNRPMTYRLHVKNTGDAVAKNARVSVQLPEGVDVVRMGDAALSAKEEAKESKAAETVASALAASQPNEDLIQWQLGDLKPGQDASMRFTAKSRSGKELAYQANASFQCTAAEKERVMTTARTETKMIAVPALLVFAVDKEDPVSVGKEVVYTIGVLNQGDAPDSNIQVVATLPDQLEFVKAEGPTKGKAEGQEITFDKLDKLPAGEQVNWQVRAKAKSEGDVIFKVKTTSDGFKKAITSEEPTKLIKVQ